MHALTLTDVRKRFGALEVLKGIDLSLEKGGFLVLLGPSGCGKSTLLNIVAGLEDLNAGEVRIGDRVANDLHPKDRNIAMVFQSYALYPSMSVRRNLAFGLKMRGVDRAEQDKAVESVAKMLDIGHLLERRPAELSGGQRQRVAMGRALVRDPVLFLFDEPLSNLDAKLRVQMRSEIKKLHNRLATTIVYVTHDQVEAMTLATMIAVMRDGEIQQYGPPEDIYQRPANTFVAGFVGSPQMNFFPAEVIAGANGPVLQVAPDAERGVAEDIALPGNGTDLTPSRRLTLGVRPEAIRRADSAATGHRFRVTIDLVENTGADTIVLFRFAGHEAAARLPAEERPQLGDVMELGFDFGSMHLFDAETTARVR
ncbi:ABC transporter ATP-binding protein [Bauldia sp.]|uniref:ABC transporter ATP-binding protein n=1 Tax=Bauldia sp. TaxID=2575872 RepID=UPI003BA84DD4